MSMKGSGSATNFREVDRFDGGVSWIAYPEETMQRASHALADDGDVWLVEFGTIAGVVVLLDRHERDAAAIARRHGVSVYVPDSIRGTVGSLNAPVERFDRYLADTGYQVRRIVDKPFWKEAALYNADNGTLVVPEAVGTAEYFTTGEERLGVHPMLRAFPPERLRGLSPERVLVGHGRGVSSHAAAVLRDAIEGSYRRAPWLYVDIARTLLSY